MFALSATYSNTPVYITLLTGLNFRTALSLSTTPVPMSRDAAELLQQLASGDNTLTNLTIEDLS